MSSGRGTLGGSTTAHGTPMDLRPHTVTAFDTDLDALRSGVLTMTRLAHRQFHCAVSAIAAHDVGLAADVLGTERRLNALHVELDAACNRLIARRQPTAVDLRQVICVLHSIGDLERIGDEAKKIARKVRSIDPTQEPRQIAEIVAMAERAGAMIQLAAESFERVDPTPATALGARDDEIDAIRDRLVAELTERIARTPERAPRLVDLIMVVQAIERVADHAEDLAEYVVLVAEGVDVRHGNLPDRAGKTVSGG